jgi:hypothetical protein
MGVHVMAEDAVVSRGPVPMCLWLVWCHSGPSDEGGWKLSTSDELTSGKSLALGVIPGDGIEAEVRRGSTYEQGESRRGEGR